MTEEKWNETVEAMEKASADFRAELAAMRVEIAEARAITESLMGYFKACAEVMEAGATKSGERGPVVARAIFHDGSVKEYHGPSGANGPVGNNGEYEFPDSADLRKLTVEEWAKLRATAEAGDDQSDLTDWPDLTDSIPLITAH